MKKHCGKKKFCKVLSSIGILLGIIVLIGLVFPTWTPKIQGKNSISELRKVKANDQDIEIMIRGCNKMNPVILFVHGGPCCSEIPYVAKYQKQLEKDFTIVHYDQRGSGKSFEFFKDYSNVSVDTHVNDLLALTEYVEKYLGKEKVILAGHSFGTYIGIKAAAQKPELYEAYVGIGQMSDTAAGELDSLKKCISAAESTENTDDITKLKSLSSDIENGKAIVPREYVRKYGFAARKINEDSDYAEGFLLRLEYNLLDVIRFYRGSMKNQQSLINESLDKPITECVKEMKIPTYFVMGKYDCMTSPEAAKRYLDSIKCNDEKEFIEFKNSAHYPQFEESDEFYKWLCEKFLK